MTRQYIKLTLKTWNKTIIDQQENVKLEFWTQRPLSDIIWTLKYVTLSSQPYIIGFRASEQMKLIEVKGDNFNNDLGTLKEEHSLKQKQEAQPCMMPDRKVSNELREPFRK